MSTLAVRGISLNVGEWVGLYWSSNIEKSHSEVDNEENEGEPSVGSKEIEGEGLRFKVVGRIERSDPPSSPYVIYLIDMRGVLRNFWPNEGKNGETKFFLGESSVRPGFHFSILDPKGIKEAKLPKLWQLLENAAWHSLQKMVKEIDANLKSLTSISILFVAEGKTVLESEEAICFSQKIEDGEEEKSAEKSLKDFSTERCINRYRLVKACKPSSRNPRYYRASAEQTSFSEHRPPSLADLPRSSSDPTLVAGNRRRGNESPGIQRIRSNLAFLLEIERKERGDESPT